MYSGHHYLIFYSHLRFSYLTNNNKSCTNFTRYFKSYTLGNETVISSKINFYNRCYL